LGRNNFTLLRRVNNLVKFITHKIISTIATLLICTLLVFFIVRLIPGDPVDHLLGERGANPELKKELMTKWGLDSPWYKQYFLFIFRGANGDLGRSIISGRSVLEEFKNRLPATIELSFFALFLALLVAVPLGFLGALKEHSIWDFICSGVSLIGYSMSVFWWGLILILVFSVHLGVTPVSGRVDILLEIEPLTGFMLIDSLLSPDKWEAFKSVLKHLILPGLTLGTIPLAYITRMTRFSLLEVFKEDFIRTAKGKGLGFYAIYFKHAFRNALIPILTVIGLMLGTLLAGAVLTETVFSWPGIGRWLINAVLSRDYPVLQGGILLVTLMIVFVNGMIDILYVKIDPRIKYSKEVSNVSKP